MHHRLRPLSTALLGVLVAALTLPAMSASPAFAKTTPAPTYLGPDVSSYQHPSSAKYPHGKPINWTSVEKAGKAFAIVKATEGTAYTNPFFDDDYQGAAKAGLVVGSYHFARPALPIGGTANAQAKYYAKTIGDVTGAGLLPPALDLEVTGGLTPPQLVTWAQVFLYKLKSLTGRVPMLYTYPYFWTNDLHDAGAFKRFPMWMASYGTSKAPVADLWQYTDSSSIPGISGGVDQSRYLSNSTLPWDTLANADGSTPIAWPTAAPSPPHGLTVTPGPSSARVAWLPGSDGSARTTSYVVTANPVVPPPTAKVTRKVVPTAPTATVNGVTTSATVTGLDPTKAYTFTVSATNSVGTCKPSAATREITPVVPTVLTPTTPHSVRVGKKITVTAQLSRGDVSAAVAKQTVTLSRRTIGTKTWTQRGSAVTDSSGTASFRLKPSRSSAYKLVFSGSPGYLPSSAVTKIVVVRPVVTAALSRSTVRRGHRVTLSGTVTPGVEGQTVTREAFIKGVWKELSTTVTDKTGAYSFTLHPAHKQKDREFRVVVAPTAVRGTGVSAIVHLAVT